jgi:polyisoprenyl-teichoic acid--peptidoglycan teichoic acid transferase
MFKKIFLISAAIFLLVAAGFSLYYGNQMVQTWDQIHEERDANESSGAQSERQEKEPQDPFSVLILGVDDEYGHLEGRSDVIMVAIVNPQEKNISLLSIPRDTYAYIRHSDRYEKINHAYAYGLNSAIETVESFLNIPIDNYIALNFDAFKDLIDMMGGIELDVERNMFHQNRRVTIDIHQGQHLLSGEEALFYVRFRGDKEGDFGRMRRQQQVMTELMNQSLNMRTASNLNELLSIVGENLRTDLKFSEVLSLAQHMSDLTGEDIETLRMEGETAMIDGVAYVMVSEEEQERYRRKLAFKLGETLAQDEDEWNAAQEEDHVAPTSGASSDIQETESSPPQQFNNE